MNINEILHNIQQELKVPKNQYNKFGGYNYRSCEDIVEAVKKILPEGVTLTLQDELEECGGRVFIRSTAILACPKGDSQGYDHMITSTGCAEVAIEQKGMQAAQITGSASSYARKYALNGLFCIDDTKDADTNEVKNQADNTPKEPVRMFEAHDIQVLEDGIEECQSIEELKAKWTTIHSYNKAGRLQQHDYESLEKVKDRKKGEM